MLSAKSRRCYHRIISGLERGGELRFLTLTSSDQSPDNIQRSWRALYMRLRRRNLITGYIKVPERTKAGKQHLHIVYRGSYVSQRLISHWWSQIHHASIVDIRQVRLYGSTRKIANYLAKYMAKDNSERYSWSWWWVWPGFCRHWSAFKAWYTGHFLHNNVGSFQSLLHFWRWWLNDKVIFHLPNLLMGFGVDDVLLLSPSQEQLNRLHPAYNLEVARWRV